MIFSIHNQKSPITLIKFQSNNSTCRATRRKLNSPNTKARHIGLISGHPCQKKSSGKGPRRIPSRRSRRNDGRGSGIGLGGEKPTRSAFSRVRRGASPHRYWFDDAAPSSSVIGDADDACRRDDGRNGTVDEQQVTGPRSSWEPGLLF